LTYLHWLERKAYSTPISEPLGCMYGSLVIFAFLKTYNVPWERISSGKHL